MTATTTPAARLPEPIAADDEEPRRSSLGFGLLRLGIFVAYVGVVVTEPGLPQNVAFVDPLIGLLCIVALVSMTRTGSPAVGGLGRLLPWYWLYLLGSMLGLAHVGITFWAMSSVIRTTVAILAFFAFWHLLLVHDLVRVARRGVYVSAVLFAISLVVVGYEYRASGWFSNPNIAGHFGVACGAVIMMISPRRAVKVAGLGLIVLTLQFTGSFGAMAMALAMGAVVATRSMQRNTAVLTIVLAGIVVFGALVITSPEAEVPTEREERSFSSSINERRFRKSQNSRFGIWGEALSAWTQEPMGIGPNGVRWREVVVRRGVPIEVHSDYIGTLVDRGPIGLIGFLGMWVVLWRLARPGGLARILIVGNLVQSLFRETINYRQLWLLLALLMVVDHLAARDGPPGPAEVDPTDEGGPSPALAAAH